MVNSRYFFCKVVCNEDEGVWRRGYYGLASLLADQSIYRWPEMHMAIALRNWCKECVWRRLGEVIVLFDG